MGSESTLWTYICLEHFQSVIRMRRTWCAVFALRTLPAIRSALVLGTRFILEIRLENYPDGIFIYTSLSIGMGRGVWNSAI